MHRVKVHLAERSYEIMVVNYLLPKVGQLIRQRTGLTYRCTVVLTIPKLRRMLGKTLERSLREVQITPFFVEIPDTEKSKSLSEYSKVLSRLTQISEKGNSFFLINLGGGVIGDLGGFVAATFKRGIPYIHIPTTLLAQVDSAIGGKTGIDLPMAKNIVGAIWQPTLVISDVSLLATLPHREFISGLAEVIKYGVIADEKIFSFLEQISIKRLQTATKTLSYLVTQCSRCKASFVQKDETDQKEHRALLNFGHTIGHAIESATDYSNQYKHGEAVSIGMICATRIAIALKKTHEGVLNRLTALLRNTGLPTKLDRTVSVKKVLKNYLFDKKFSNNRIRFVLPTRIGHAIVCEGIPEPLIREVVESCR